MNERWFYRIGQQVKGPLNFEALQSLAADGTLSSGDEVRTNREHTWRKAGSVPDLFPEIADADDLSAMLMEESLDAPVALRVESVDACYCRIQGVEMGPMPFMQLMLRAHDGELAPNDEVRLGDDAEWIEAGAVAGLFKSRPQSAPAVVSADDATAFVADDGDFELQSAGASEPAPERGARDSDVSEDAWYWQVAGQEMGPFTFEKVVELARGGRLARNDKLRRGRDGEWTAAGTFEGLFPEEEPHEHDDVQTENSEDEFGFEDFMADAAAQQKTRKSRKGARRRSDRRDPRHGTARSRKPTMAEAASPARETQPQKVRSAPERAPEPAAQQPEPVASPPTPVTPPSPPPRPVFTPPPPPRTRSSVDWSDLKEKVKYPAIAAVALLIGYGLWNIGLPSFSAGGAESDEVIAIYSEALARRQPDYGTPEGWNEFKQRSLPRLKAIADELEQGGADDDRSKILLRCCRDYLPAILNAGPTKTPKELQEMSKSLESLES